MFVVKPNVNVEWVSWHAKVLFYPTSTQSRINVYLYQERMQTGTGRYLWKQNTR